MQIIKKKSNFRSDLPAGESKSTTALPNLPIGRRLQVQSPFILERFATIGRLPRCGEANGWRSNVAALQPHVAD